MKGAIANLIRVPEKCIGTRNVALETFLGTESEFDNISKHTNNSPRKINKITCKWIQEILSIEIMIDTKNLKVTKDYPQGVLLPLIWSLAVYDDL